MKWLPRALAIVWLAPVAAHASPWGDACNACPANARWREGAEIRFEVPRDALSSSLAYDLRDAARVWNAGPCMTPAISAEVKPETRFERDGVSAVVFVEQAPESGGDESVVAATCNRCDESGFIVESDIALFGPEAQWNDNCLSPSFSQRGVLLHEIGHALGLPHAAGEGGSVMTGLVSTDRSQRFGSPGEGDFSALCDRYGARAEEEAFTEVEPGCSSVYAEAGQPCDEVGPVPAGLVCVAESAGPVWRWVCDEAQACEAGSQCFAMEEEGAWGVCEPDAPERDAALGAVCGQDADCATGLCFAGLGQTPRCLERCAPSLRCGGECIDVVKDAQFRGRWCMLGAPTPEVRHRLLGCETAAGTSSWAGLVALLLLAVARRLRAIRLASRGAAP